MYKGAFALLDCLGFKGSWVEHGAKAIVDKLTKVEEIVSKQCEPINLRFPSINENRIIAEVKFLSDTVALGVRFDDPGPETNEYRHEVIRIACEVVARINSHFLLQEPSFLLRGCMTFGEYLMQGNFIIGPAVDRAAEFEKLANGAFVWLDPLASDLYQQSVDLTVKGWEDEHSSLSNGEEPLNDIDSKKHRAALKGHIATGKIPLIIRNYDLPLKGGESLNCSVLNPLFREGSPGVRKETADIYDLRMQNQRLDIIIKRQNTMRFLKKCEEETENYYASLVRNLKDYHQLL